MADVVRLVVLEGLVVRQLASLELPTVWTWDVPPFLPWASVTKKSKRDPVGKMAFHENDWMFEGA